MRIRLLLVTLLALLVLPFVAVAAENALTEDDLTREATATDASALCALSLQSRDVSPTPEPALGEATTPQPLFQIHGSCGPICTGQFCSVPSDCDCPCGARCVGPFLTRCADVNLNGGTCECDQTPDP